MKQELILGMLLCLVILSFKNEEKEEQLFTNADKIARELQRDVGPFDAVYYYNDSLVVMYTYRPEANRTRKVKGVIDKTLNMVGEEMIPNFLNLEYHYRWETPTEMISLQGVYKESDSYLNVWVYAK